ncbi:MAG: phenylalanine--tRNA ligase subunit beta [Crocinitomicaceae bacterium]|nr:phenylalanine--tRNA ligase subunit beta [Crocinitomicaceae bacterium]
MKVSYNWLKQYTSINATPEELDKILTDTGLEVEGVEKVEAIKGGLAGVVVGEVMECEKHPDADKLKVTKVDVGTGELLQIVCGAPNVAKGQKVVVATVGTTLYPTPEESFKIKVSKIRGVESFGMLCAEDELGLGKGHDGILVLDSSLKIGTPAATVFELEDDYTIEIGLTPNRADAMGHIGVVRDYIAYQNVHNDEKLALQLPALSDLTPKNQKETVAISIENADLCPKYCGITISGISVKPSPAWLQKRLRAVGLSPINNVVDVTNFVMRELGTPLHAFDCAKLNGKIVVKTAKKGEKFTTLDGVERTLSENNLMITNESENLCIAGVYGGLDSGVKDTTTSVFIESAYFNPVSVRKTAKEHGLNTDASFRFERGVDPSLTEYALRRCVSLILEVAGGEVAMNETVVGSMETTREVNFNYAHCNRLIGTEIPREKVNQILENLEITIQSVSGDDAVLVIPAYRVDVVREADVIEEVLRVYGFNNIPLPEKMNMSIGVFPKPDIEKVQTTISEFLVGKGFNEMLNNSLTKSAYVNNFGGNELKSENDVPILNPLSTDLDVMRQSLLFNALEVVEHNQNRQNPDLRLFEFGKVYHKYATYTENKRLLIAVSGKKLAENWNDSSDAHSFYSLKGIVVAVLKRMGLDSFLKEKAIEKDGMLDGIQLYLLKSKIGNIGRVSNQLKKQFNIKNDVFIADLDWDALLNSLKMNKIVYKELPKTFAVRRDFSLLLDKSVTYADIEAIARNTEKNLLKEVGLFDVYEGKNLPEGKKSYAVSFLFQDNEKTLQDAQLDTVMSKIRKNLEEQLGAELR